MNSRIKQFMDHKGLTSSELADSIGVQRSNVTHVLHNRNKPSFQFISKMLETYPELNAKWLLLGNGKMLENGESVSPNLFQDVNETITDEPKPEIKQQKISTTTIEKDKQVTSPENAQIAAISGSVSKDIERIVVFYSDQTFKQYTPSK